MDSNTVSLRSFDRPGFDIAPVMFGCTAFGAAILLFLLEPMFVKMALPQLGGSSEVWTACVLCYQLTLLAGYAYAHLLLRLRRVVHQALIHAGLSALAAVVLPFAIPATWQPAGAAGAVPWLILTLLRTVGAPFFVLAATSPLMQAWFALARPGRDPYPLYAASNVGSLAALLAYPFVIEPLWGLHAQSVTWAIAYIGFALTIGCCGFVARRAARDCPATESAGPAPIGIARRLRWIGLACVPASLMLSVTTYLSERVAPIPLLWTLPLGIYLASFVVVFGTRARSTIMLANRALPILLLPLVFVMSFRIALPVAIELPLHLTVFAVVALVCHGAVAQDKPDPRQLTEFYLYVAIGGACGGAFNSVIAPLIFPDVFEYPIVLACACFTLARRSSGSRPADARLDVGAPLVLGVGLMLALAATAREPLPWQMPTALIAIAAATFVCFTFVERPLRLGLGIAALLTAATLRGPLSADLHVERNFYGVKQVSAIGTIHALSHGHTYHGAEDFAPGRERETLTYYTRSGPLGDIFSVPRSARPAVAVVGLGAGSTACYRRPGAAWTFFEIDPGVVAIARDPRLFRYLADCAPDSPIVVGDGRLSLGRAVAHSFDLIVLDAYASDAIPTHLLTREAMRVYAGRLAAHGAIVFHISNKYFDFAPLVAALAKDAGMVARRRIDDPHAPATSFISGSTWMIVARNSADLGPIERDSRWTAPAPGERVWTDDYTSIATLLRFHR